MAGRPVHAKSVVNLVKGWPNPSLLPAHALKAASNRVLSNLSTATPSLQYGPDGGYDPLREELARWLTTFYSPIDAITAPRICVTGGASQNLACLLQTFTDPIYTRNIWMVAPAYHLACRIFDDASFAGKLRSVPEDAGGIDVHFLEKEVDRTEQGIFSAGSDASAIKPSRPWRKTYRHLIYAVPTFANPSGRCMSLERREQLVRLARQIDALIVTDDVYDFLQWPSSFSSNAPLPEKAGIPRIVDVDRYLDGGPKGPFGNAVSNGSFSKIVGPGCRTGWAEGTETFVHGLSQTGTSRSGGCASQLVASCIHQMLATNALQEHVLQVLQPTYARRYYTIMKAIEKHLVPFGFSAMQGDTDLAGGYFVWLKLPESLNSKLIAEKAAEKENLLIADGNLFQVQGDDKSGIVFDRYIRLSFAYETEENLSEGVERLAQVIRQEMEPIETMACAP